MQLADQKRRDYEPYAPIFQRPAENAMEIHRPWFDKLVDDPENGTFVHENATGEIDGFVIVAVGPAPPVYDPGGKSALIDDFAVASPSLWATAGAALLDAAQAWAREQGAVQVVVVCGPHDQAKRGLLQGAGLYLASEWFTAPFSDEAVHEPT